MQSSVEGREGQTVEGGRQRRERGLETEKSGTGEERGGRGGGE